MWLLLGTVVMDVAVAWNGCHCLKCCLKCCLNFALSPPSAGSSAVSTKPARSASPADRAMSAEAADRAAERISCWVPKSSWMAIWTALHPEKPAALFEIVWQETVAWPEPRSKTREKNGRTEVLLRNAPRFLFDDIDHEAASEADLTE